VHSDTQWLSHNNLIDYSLLVGADARSRKLVLGIIDYNRQYRPPRHASCEEAVLVVHGHVQQPSSVLATSGAPMDRLVSKYGHIRAGSRRAAVGIQRVPCHGSLPP
jgi:hypothetical protein